MLSAITYLKEMLPMTGAMASISLCVLILASIKSIGIVRSYSSRTRRIIAGNSELTKFMTQTLQPLLDQYSPTWWTNSHIQCILMFLVRQHPVQYERDVLTLQDGGQTSLDWALESSVDMKLPLRDDSPIVIIMHGLVGCSKSMQSLCAEAITHGYRPVVFNKRGHGGMKLATPRLQGFGCVKDLKEAIDHVKNKFPHSKLYGIGCSAGAGLLSSYLGELGDKSLLRAGVLISPGYNAFDLFCAGRINRIYDFLMTFTLKLFLLRHKNELQNVVDIPRALRAMSIREFDQHVYMKMHGYADLESYWKVNNPMRDLENLTMPILCINALDDPVCTEEMIPYNVFQTKPNAMLLTTAEGSHCAFFEGTFQLKSWCNTVAMEYLDRLQEFENLSDSGVGAATPATA
ncbi:hypothetical protein PsorP6_008410 [Peronosclerospora sorghi]|uniref:Uncharacterized protein n=1 Tax=Peronosclerospora sorghi TaxID=230839 RepID=A0ACC0W8G2_9STRA|nr:hypothetical protein PsorP6_008410 [Peronosclerospora sorghi]